MGKIKKESLGTRLVNGLDFIKEEYYYFENFDQSETCGEHEDYEVFCRHEDYNIHFFCDFTLSGGDLMGFEEETNSNDVRPVKVSNLEVKSIWINRKDKVTNYDFNTLEFEPNDFSLSFKNMIYLKHEFINILNQIQN